jgi:uncharacterized membrane protein
MKENENSTQGRSNDESRFARMQVLLSKSLLYGVLASTAIVIIGLIMMAVTNSTGYGCDASSNSLSCLLNYNENVIPHANYPIDLASLVSGLAQLKPFSVIQLGVIVLLATPVFRVFASLVLFAIQKDRPFILITLFVFLVLLFSFFVAPDISFFKA